MKMQCGAPCISKQRGIHGDVMLVWKCHVPIIVLLSCHHVVTCGFHCFCGLYDHSYNMATVRCVIALAAAKGWSLQQMVVKNAFLHGDLQEEVYMEQLAGYEDFEHPMYVCRVKKELYGLKQAPRAWSNKIGEYIVNIGFYVFDVDHSLY